MTTYPDQYAALTALFTTDSGLAAIPSLTPEPEIVVVPSPRIECLLPGHLPVRAHAWYLPCARSLVGPRHPGVLARIEEEQVQLTSFGLDREEADRFDSLPELARVCGQWFILPDSRIEYPEVTGFDADRITILTGADQAALVAAYQMIKSIVSGASVDPLKLDIGLFIAGSPEAQAVETASRLADTARRQLGCVISFRGSIQRIEHDDSSSCGMRMPLPDGGINAFVSDVRSALACPRSTGSTVEPVLPVKPMKLEPPAVENVPMEFTPAKLMPAPSEDLETVETPGSMDTPGGHGSLASNIDGLVLLPFRCPSCDHIELAVDESGRVHCLGDIDDLRSLLIAEGWVISQGSLLQAACADHRVTDCSSPTLHGFTSDPMKVSDLHGTTLQLHLLVEVQVGDSQTWFSTRLS